MKGDPQWWKSAKLQQYRHIFTRNKSHNTDNTSSSTVTTSNNLVSTNWFLHSCPESSTSKKVPCVRGNSDSSFALKSYLCSGSVRSEGVNKCGNKDKAFTAKAKVVKTDSFAQISSNRSVLPQQCWQKLLTGSSWEDVSCSLLLFYFAYYSSFWNGPQSISHIITFQTIWSKANQIKKKTYKSSHWSVTASHTLWYNPISSDTIQGPFQGFWTGIKTAVMGL